ncbi:MAG TPA: M28 family peptidase [Bryobacteraceae bacterium]|nr:M28 family peptidase [Bryobacteraceae bacterium]
MARRIPGQPVAAFCGLAAAVLALAAGPALTRDQSALAGHISANSLRGHLSFLASDLLQGRATPSRGLDIAAEYIAAQFRRAGLEPAGDHEYFQTAVLQPPLSGKARNVAGLLRGSDPVLRDTYVILSAHYDHLGMRSKGQDRIYNGANDDGSGTVSVIEIASAFAALPRKPKRSILFLAFFGEERGLLGSQYYIARPLEPLAKTIADVNLEQLGRTDATGGPHVGSYTITGFDDSNLPQELAAAARLESVRVYKDPAISDKYFSDSDNFPFDKAGIPAHTLTVAADFPDYHRVGDEWQKIDYENMAKVDRAIALGLLQLASGAPPPKWLSRR